MRAILFNWAIIQSFVLGTSVLMRRSTKANNFLALLFLLSSLKLGIQYLMRFTVWKDIMPHVVFVPDIIDLIEPVLILFYLNTIIGRTVSDKSFRLLIPAILVSVGLSSFVVFTPDYSFFSYIGTPLHLSVLGGILMFKTFLLIKIYHLFRDYAEMVSHKKQKDLLVLWPKMLVYITAITVPLFILIFIYHAIIVPQLGPQPSEPFRIILEQIYIIVNGGTILLAGFHLMKNPAILKEQIIQKEKPEKVSEEVDENIQRLHQLIEEDNVHLDHNLSEKLLAEKLGIQAYLLSRLLNDHLGMTFRQFVNEKRIGFAKELLRKPENHDLTIFAVAVDSGFNSESVFYVNFKKYTGMTPTQFKKECIKQHKLSKEAVLKN